ncbi:MAG: bifunctional folylpolyglutamate synthase/dihydrofolate synthase [Clostridiales bacterium]|nr:bifunctional folylpolyglutamate synthase/dihydrofolate synthase [Clostridiales bacterium]
MRQLCSPAIKPGLERINALLDELGHPERELCAIHVGGTNGKGSVCAMLDAILLAAGLHSGRFISPHLHDYRERCLIDGQMLSEQQTARLLQQVINAMQALTARGGPLPTEFEASTALSLLAFAEAKIERAVLEVGLGGRFDATNVVEAPLAIITNIGRDHMEYLGESISGIAAEKAGIIKRGARVFTAAQGEALAVIEREAAAQGAELCRLGQELHCRAISHDESGQYVEIITPRGLYENLRLSLLGAHQCANAALAVAAAEAAGVDEAAIRRGLETAFNPARLEIISRQPLIVLDGAHNAPAMAVLARALADYWPRKHCLALLGMLADKEREQALAYLAPYLDGAIISRPPLLSRSGDWAKTADFCAGLGLPVPAENIIADIPAACERALALLPAYDMLLVCGSLYLVAEAREYLTGVCVSQQKNLAGASIPMKRAYT